MEFLDRGIVIAPGSLHLDLYNEIYKQKGNSLNISALTLQSFLLSHLDGKPRTLLQLIYDAKEALKDLSKDNSFYDSREDYDFLNACIAFMQLSALYELHSFPSDTQKEKDLLEVIEKLQVLDLWQKQIKDLTIEHPEQVQILKTEYPIASRKLIELLKAQGAMELTVQPKKHRKFYWSASNTRKEIEAAAQAIIDQDLQAEDVFVALSNPGDQMVLAQIFHSRNIPFTFLHPEILSEVSKMFEAAITYIYQPTPMNLEVALRTLYPRQSSELLHYLAQMDPNHSIANLAYEQNPIFDAEEFAQMQSLEAQAQSWLPWIQDMESWDHTSFEKIAGIIQEQIANPTAEDQASFTAITSAWMQVMDQIHGREDLKLFLNHLNHVHPSRTSDSISGVLVGTRAEISGLRPYVFIIGASNHTFPGYTLHEGIFDEAYMEKIKEYPSLDERLAWQQENVRSILEIPESLFVTTPQSDFEGKTIHPSNELTDWIGQLPKYQNPRESNIISKPDFTLNTQVSSNLFLNQDHQLQTRVSNLMAYQDCPYRHLLQYGLRVHGQFRLEDHLVVRAEILNHILENARMVYQKPFYQLSQKEIEQLVRQEFSFVYKVFPHRKHAIDVLVMEYQKLIEQYLVLLKEMETDWNMDLVPSDYLIHVQDELQGTPVSITGALNPKGSGRTTFNLYEKNDPYALDLPEPAATMSLNFQIKPVKQNAMSISYGRGSLPANVKPSDNAKSEEEFFRGFLQQSFIGQNIPEEKTGVNPSLAFLSQKVKTYEERSEDLKQTAALFLDSLKQDCILPEHKKGACQYCHFKAICRNGSKERED